MNQNGRLTHNHIHTNRRSCEIKKSTANARLCLNVSHRPVLSQRLYHFSSYHQPSASSAYIDSRIMMLWLQVNTQSHKWKNHFCGNTTRMSIENTFGPAWPISIIVHPCTWPRTCCQDSKKCNYIELNCRSCGNMQLPTPLHAPMSCSLYMKTDLLLIISVHEAWFITEHDYTSTKIHYISWLYKKNDSLLIMTVHEEWFITDHNYKKRHDSAHLNCHLYRYTTEKPALHTLMCLHNRT